MKQKRVGFPHTDHASFKNSWISVNSPCTSFISVDMVFLRTLIADQLIFGLYCPSTFISPFVISMRLYVTFLCLAVCLCFVIDWLRT